jgi:hypothetical protein
MLIVNRAPSVHSACVTEFMVANQLINEHRTGGGSRAVGRIRSLARQLSSRFQCA